MWVAVRGQNYVSVISTRTGRELHRIYTANGPSKVVFSPDGTLAYVNHLRARVAEVIRVADRRIIKTIHGTAPQSSDEAISPDGRELWLGHPFTGQTTVIDAKRMRVIAIMNTGPRTNHPQFITKPDGAQYAYLTIGGLNETRVYRDHGGAPPTLVTTIKDHGYGPHGIWPSPDNTRVYVALQNSDGVDVIDTATNTVIKTLHVGQDPMALVYVANAVPHGSGRQGLGRQGLNQPVENLAVQTQGVPGTASLTVRQLADTDMLVFNAHGLAPHRTVTLSGIRPNGNDDPAVLGPGQRPRARRPSPQLHRLLRPLPAHRSHTRGARSSQDRDRSGRPALRYVRTARPSESVRSHRWRSRSIGMSRIHGARDR